MRGLGGSISRTLVKKAGPIVKKNEILLKEKKSRDNEVLELKQGFEELRTFVMVRHNTLFLSYVLLFFFVSVIDLVLYVICIRLIIDGSFEYQCKICIPLFHIRRAHEELELLRHTLQIHLLQ